MSKPRSNVVLLPKASSPSWDDCRLLVESAVDYAIFMLDVDGHVATWNVGAERIKGYTADEIIGQHFSKFYPPDDIIAGKPQRELDIARSVGRAEDEGWRVRKNGSLFWASVIITALRDEGGTLRGYGKVTRDLTARRANEEQLRRAEERFHHLVDAVIDYAIFSLDSTGHVSMWNEGARRVKGYAAEEIVGKHFSVFYTPEDRAAGKPETILEAVRREGRYEDESWRVRKDGSHFWANVIITALRSDDGALVGFAKVTRDLTFRREAEEKDRKLLREQTAREVAEEAERRLRQSEERYRALSQRLEIVLEGVADGITVQDRSGRVVFANSAAARICGYGSAAELMNTPPAEVVARFEVLDEHGRPFDATGFPGRRVLSGERTSDALLRVRERASGRQWWSFVRASAVFDADGKPELAVNIWHDVTAGRREEEQVKFLADATAALGSSLDSNEMLSTLAAALVPGLADWCSIHLLEGDRLRSVAVAHTDPAKIATAKEYQRRFPPDPDGGGSVWNVVRTGKPELYNDITDEMLVQAGRGPEHLEALRSVGMKSVLLAPISIRSRVLGVISFVSAESGRRYETSDVALVLELGRRAGAALENAQLYAQAHEAVTAAEDASRAKDEFLATVSHELRTPLSAIVGWATLLKDRVTDPALSKPLEVIHRNALAQVNIVDDILDVSRVITGKFRLEAKPADLVAITKQAIEVVRPSLLAKKIDIELKPHADFCLLVADPERLQQVVWNLLSNAVKFTDAGGQVRVAVRQEGSTVVLSVADTGTGIDPAFLPFVFDRFKQADSSIRRRVAGLGLGLSLVRHIVELHGGKVTVASDGIGKGATFTVTLPIRAVIPWTEEGPVPRARAAESWAPVALASVRVLIVDDEADALDFIAAVLVQAGAVVEKAMSAAEGMEAFRRFGPDVLVSDIGMPDEDGFSFMRRIRGLSPAEGCRIPSLALTAFAREEDRTRALGAGYTTHIGKPVDPRALTAAVANLAALRPA
jgi:PAS domain S-box-containing protein